MNDDMGLDDLHESLIETFQEEARELLVELETALLELEGSPEDEELINRSFRALHTIKGNAAMFGFGEIEEFTHDLESVFDHIRKGRRTVDKELIDLTLAAKDVIYSMLDGKTGEGIEWERTRLVSLINAIVIEDSSGDDIRTANGEKPEEIWANQKEEARSENNGSSIRVAADKLDKLVDLVGEMVTVQARLTQMVSQRVDPALNTVAEEVEALTWELRENAFSIRMVPIGATYRRITRLVRDLSRELSQEVQLVTEGAETELDKNVIEKITDPLMHLIRNSVDHGIEPPDVRENCGKPGSGTVRLSATNSGADVVLTVEDDGSGLDTEAIRRKALEKRLISEDSELTESEINNLVFVPGFSTAGEVTSVSGRGVGLDVVKRSIEGMRGSVEVHSRPGQGTVFTIRLPLTLAIIEGLLLLVGSEKYIVPLSLVEECVFLTSTDEAAGHGRNITRLRGEIVPYVKMREWFATEGQPPEIQQVVIVREEGKRLGILVDNVIGEHQTVIKSLGKVYRDVDGVSGATILGDGTVSLILDVPRIMRVTEEMESRFSNQVNRAV